LTYTTHALNQPINFVDNSDKTTVVGTQDIPGTVGKTVSLTKDGSNNTTKLSVPEHWTVVGQAPTSITFGSKDGDPMTVYVEHIKTPVNVDENNWD
ncbi:hypothetical protein, partial [Bartonella sp. CL63NXGY]|uniref:hypothetical protein n=1 Tax=Bartonella sp. CL63NXGY TaxID=3243538 RepID=UPI0035D015A8